MYTLDRNPQLKDSSLAAGCQRPGILLVGIPKRRRGALPGLQRQQEEIMIEEDLWSARVIAAYCCDWKKRKGADWKIK